MIRKRKLEATNIKQARAECQDILSRRGAKKITLVGMRENGKKVFTTKFKRVNRKNIYTAATQLLTAVCVKFYVELNNE